jgi:hypothetical protein
VRVSGGLTATVQGTLIPNPATVPTTKAPGFGFFAGMTAPGLIGAVVVLKKMTPLSGASTFFGLLTCGTMNLPPNQKIPPFFQVPSIVSRKNRTFGGIVHRVFSQSLRGITRNMDPHLGTLVADDLHARIDLA